MKEIKKAVKLKQKAQSGLLNQKTPSQSNTTF